MIIEIHNMFDYDEVYSYAFCFFCHSSKLLEESDMIDDYG